MLGSRMFEPVLAAVAVLVAGLDALGGIPVRPLPAEGLAVAGAGRDQPVVNRRFADAPRGLVLAEREVRRVQQAETFADPLAQVLAVALERHVAADVDLPQVGRRMAGAHPLGHDLADTAG